MKKVQKYALSQSTSAQSFILIKKDLLKDGVYEIQSALGKFVDLDNSGVDWGTNIHTWIEQIKMDKSLG